MGKTRRGELFDCSVSTAGMSREDWLALRRTGIGGSDAAAVLGVSDYASPLSVYYDKLGEFPEKETNEAMIQGTLCEEVVAKRFAAENPRYKVVRDQRMYRRPDLPWMVANVDRRVLCTEYGGYVGLECKTTSPYAKADFEGGEVPKQYFWQCQHYMAVTNATCWFLAVMQWSKGWYTFWIPRDEAAIGLLIDAERELWCEHILKRVPPLPTGTDADNEALDLVRPAEQIERIALPGVSGLLDQLAVIRADRERIERREEAVKQQIKQQMGSLQLIEAGRWKVDWKENERKSVDSKKLKAMYPGVYDDCVKIGKTRTFSVSEIK